MIVRTSFSLLLVAGFLVCVAPLKASAQTVAHPCAQQHAAAVAACRPDPCTVTCKQARAAVKQCRIDNNIAKNPAPAHPMTGKKCPALGAPIPNQQQEAPVAPN